MRIFEDYLMFFTSDRKKIFYCKWLRPVSSAELRKGAHVVYKYLKESKADLWLLDASNTNTPIRADQEWVIAEVCRLIKQNTVSIRKMALVKSRDIFFELIADAFERRLNELCDSKLSMQHFDSIPEAYTWLLANSAEEEGGDSLLLPPHHTLCH